ncbi:MAG: HAMP domain-containing histidine kinase [Chloroflexi bacterium]|nr:HAMP domain-containing histidine kinase [Chloroflexota bacterium]MCC6895958.1 HAMP domain-containing histidine kinase [Anaerolineae bacterium]
MAFMEPNISLNQAIEVLKRLQSAAPAATAAKLSQVAELIQQLSDENTYLNSLVLDDMPPLAEPMQPSAPRSLASVSLEDDFAALMGTDPYPENTDEDVSFTADNFSSTQAMPLFTGLSDSLRPPLVAIRGRAELVQGGLLGQITPEQDTWLEAIQENTNRAFAVLDAVQEMIAIQQGKVRIEPVNFLATDLLTEAWERTRDRAKQLGHNVTIQAPDLVPVAHGDFYQSIIVLTDLLDNAMRYTPPGGSIRLSVDNLGTHVLLSVADNGIGLRPEDLDFIGKPFWRGSHHKLVRAHAGTGLRLYLAKQVLALQDGELIFTGEAGTGSTFSFTLPIPE